MRCILFFGIYDPRYARNRVLYEGFKRNGWEITECHVDPKVNRGILKYLKLFLLGLKAWRERYDLVLVCFPGHTVMPLARFLFGPRVVFDAFLSVYDSNVFDRKVYPANSLRAWRDKMLDTWSCKLARKVLLDTNQHIEYFVKTFGISREKFIRMWISADDTMFFPTNIPEAAVFTVHFYGTFIPLQGIQYIIEAANILRDEDIRFRIVGSGQERERIERQIEDFKLDTIEWIGKVPVERVPGYMAGAHVVLGIFGDTEKTKRVIPNKVYEAMAMGKAIITADTPAIRELEGASAALKLIPVANAKALADAILELKNDSGRRKILGLSARALFERECLPEQIIKNLIEELQRSSIRA
ncbi:glycosyltransferase [Candidatus Kaiserbacteria bacterium]|nr:glycosyltransferase [Candidatus Kaiserbacteria bacterium]